MISNENKLKDLEARKLIMRKTVSEIEQGAVPQTVEMTQKQYDAKILGTVPYLTTHAVIMVYDSPITVLASVAQSASSYIAPYIRPVILFHAESVIKLIDEFGEQIVWKFMPFIVAHELRHYGQLLEGVCVFQEYHEIDADSVALADSKLPELLYKKFPEILYYDLTGKRYESLLDNTATYDLFTTRRNAVLDMYRNEESLPDAKESYKMAADMVMNEVLRMYKRKSQTSTPHVPVKIASGLIVPAAIATGAYLFNKRRS